MKHSTPRSQGASERTFPEATALSDESGTACEFVIEEPFEEACVSDLPVELSTTDERGCGGPNTCFFGIGTRPPL